MNLAQALYDSLGNEIFAGTIEKLRSDPTNQVVVVSEVETCCTFPDGSKIIFKDGFAHACGGSPAAPSAQTMNVSSSD